tara:strand:+ start:146 stop:487 length:342 start_codon:yes stop_codon:yes gene_type:complete
MVKIYEVTEVQENEELDFDIVEDTCAFMRNDSQFYRKQFFPVMSKIAEMHRDGKKINHRKHMGPMIERGINEYCNKFDIARSPDEVFTQTDRDALIDKLFGEEMEQIKQGDYK